MNNKWGDLHIMAELYRACRNDDINKVNEILENSSKIQKFKIDVNYVDIDSGNTPLLAAYENGNLKIVKLLLEYGANPNIQTMCGNTILIFGSFYNNEKMVKIILEKSRKYIDVNIKDDVSKSAVSYSISNRNDKMLNNLLSYEVYVHNHKIQIHTLLLIFLIHKYKYNLPNEILYMVKLYHTINFKYT